MRRLMLIGLLLSICGCAMKTRIATVRMYNMTTGEAVAAQYTYNGSGRGRVAANLPSGEHMEGEYYTVVNYRSEWGIIYTYVWGVSATSSTYSTAYEAYQHGTGVLMGDRGTSMSCEYLTNASTGSGTGACSDNRGALWKLMF